MSSSTVESADQASRLRAMVQTVYGPGVTMLTYAAKGEVPAGRLPISPAPINRTSETLTAPVRVRTAAQPAQRTIPVIAITSGKGGVGKTCVAVNLAAMLTRRGHRVALLDADMGLANADLLCGLNPVNRLDAAVDPAHRRGLDSLAVEAPGGFRLVPGSAGLAKMANLPPAQRAALVNSLVELESISDVVLVDTGAGLSDGVLSFVAAADLALVVVTPEPTSVADAYAMIKVTSRAANPPRIALVVNQAAREDEAFELHRRIAGTCKKFLGLDLPLYGTLRLDDAVRDSVRARQPIAVGTPRAKFCRDLGLTAERVGTVLKLKTAPRGKPGSGGLFGWLRGR